MAYRLSKRSIDRMKGVHVDLVSVTHRAIEITSVDFGVGEGLRLAARQRRLVASGASKTMRSRHLTGHAIDLVAYVGSRVSWDWPLYYSIAEAMKQASDELGVPIEWGAAWRRTLSDFPSARAASADYVRKKLAAGDDPFLDGPHFQLPWKEYPA